MDRGETPEKAAAREVDEETWLQVTAADPPANIFTRDEFWVDDVDENGKPKKTLKKYFTHFVPCTMNDPDAVPGG